MYTSQVSHRLVKLAVEEIVADFAAEDGKAVGWGGCVGGGVVEYSAAAERGKDRQMGRRAWRVVVGEGEVWG